MKNRAQIRKVGIIGTGMIGTSLAVLTTGHGFETVVLAMNDELQTTAQKQYHAFFEDIKANGLLKDEQIQKCAGKLKYTQSYEDLSECDLIFEAVVEIPDVKHEVLAKIEAHCPKIRAICSVSSAIVVDEMVKKMEKYQSKVIVTHPFFPPHLIPFFEIAAGSQKDEEVVQTVKTFLEDLDRKPVVLKKSAPGFIGNRLQFALWREALNIVEQGIADPKDVDTCLNYSFCPRYTSIGMYESFDNAGLTLNFNVCNAIFPSLSNATSAPKILSDLVEKGELGVPTGKGFYDWSDVDMVDFKKRISAPYWKYFNWEV